MLHRYALVSLLYAGMLPFGAFAAPEVIQDGDAKQLMEEKKGQSVVLAQRDKVFFLRNTDGTEEEKPKKLTVKVGDTIFITNEEEKIVHNVYDKSDGSWVLKKQQPGGVAAVTFSEAGKHKLKCAIHPKMKITVNVEG